MPEIYDPSLPPGTRQYDFATGNFRVGPMYQPGPVASANLRQTYDPTSGRGPSYYDVYKAQLQNAFLQGQTPGMSVNDLINGLVPMAQTRTGNQGTPTGGNVPPRTEPTAPPPVTPPPVSGGTAPPPIRGASTPKYPLPIGRGTARPITTNDLIRRSGYGGAYVP